MTLASSRKLTLELQLEAVNEGLKIFKCFGNKHADMSKTGKSITEFNPSL